MQLLRWLFRHTIYKDIKTSVLRIHNLALDCGRYLNNKRMMSY